MRITRVLLALTLGVGGAFLLPQTAANAADCQHTFHARPTVTGYQDDPCTTRVISAPDQTFTIKVRWFWNMAGGAHIENVQAVITPCRVPGGIAQWVRGDADSVNRSSDGVAINHSLTMTDPSAACVTLLTPATAVTGCGAVGTPGAGVTVFARGRGTWLDIFDNVHRIPADGTTYASTQSYYKMC